MQFNEYNTYNASKSFRYDLSKTDNRLSCRKVEKSVERDVSSVETFLRNVFLPEGKFCFWMNKNLIDTLH